MWWLMLLLVIYLCALGISYFLACLTFVGEGTAKIVIRGDAHLKTLLAKKGYKLNSEGDVVPLEPNEKPEYPEWLGGIRFVSWLYPLGIDKIYKKVIQYKKALPDGGVESRQEETDFILAAVHYQYGIELRKAEDRNELPLDITMVLTAQIINPYKAFFKVKDWYNAMIQRILPHIREYISEHTYEQIIKTPGQLDIDIMNKLRENLEQGNLSIFEVLRNEYGIEVIKLQTLNIDPPEGYREITLAKWRAKQVAAKEAEEIGGRILKIVARLAGISIAELQQKLREHPELRGLPHSQGGFKEDFERAWDQVKRDRAGEGLEDIRVGNVDGTPLSPIIDNLAALIGLGKHKSKRKKNPTSSPQGDVSGFQDGSQYTIEQLEQALKEIEEREGKKKE